jgi:hypothetical protein
MKGSKNNLSIICNGSFIQNEWYSQNDLEDKKTVQLKKLIFKMNNTVHNEKQHIVQYSSFDKVA